jgi:NTP pyrophosphatase (non-canonical NTP hydrolase)
MNQTKRLKDPVYNKFLKAVEFELDRISTKKYEIKSLHEGYALLLEEVDEVKDITWARASNRSLAHLDEELAQVIAIALCIHKDIVMKKNNR